METRSQSFLNSALTEQRSASKPKATLRSKCPGIGICVSTDFNDHDENMTSQA